MIRLGQGGVKVAPVDDWLDLGLGVKVQLGPFDPAADVCGQRASSKYLQEQLEEMRRGELADAEVIAGVNDAAEVEAVIAVARRRIVAWVGVGDDDGEAPAPCTPANIEAVFRQVPSMLATFRIRYADHVLAWTKEGNAFGLLPPGIGGKGQPTAETAERSANHAPQPSDGAATSPL